MGKPRSKKEKDETNIMEETQEIYIPPEKRKQIIKDFMMYLRLQCLDLIYAIILILMCR